MVAALQTAVIGYGLEKHYETWSRSWVVVKGFFTFLKAKIWKKKEAEKEIKEKSKDIRLKVRKSSLKRLANIIINSVAKTCN